LLLGGTVDDGHRATRFTYAGSLRLEDAGKDRTKNILALLSAPEPEPFTMKAIALALALEGIARSPEPEQNPFTMKAIALALALALLATCSALPHGWRHSHRASPGNKLEVSFWLNLPSAGLTALEGELKARSDPSSALYAQWLSNAEVHAMVAPAPEAVNEVLAFLSDAGIEEHRVRFPTPNSDVLVLEVTVAEAERLLETEFAVYKHDGVGMAATRALQKEYALPARVARHVAFVGPVFGRLPQAQTASMVAAPQWNDDDGNPSPVNTPDTLRTLYNVGDTEGTSSTLQAVTAFLGQMYSASDLDAFWNKYAQYAETDVGLVGDATAGTPGGVESMLDIEYVTAPLLPLLLLVLLLLFLPSTNFPPLHLQGTSPASVRACAPSSGASAAHLPRTPRMNRSSRGCTKLATPATRQCPSSSRRRTARKRPPSCRPATPIGSTPSS